MRLRRAPDTYDRDDQSVMRSDLERADAENLKANSFPTVKEFTPGMTFGGAFVGGSLSTATGKAVKAGRLVWFTLRVTLSDKGSSTGALKITGLPYTTDNSDVAQSPLSVVYKSVILDTAGGFSQLAATVDQNATTLSLYECGDDVTDTAITEADVTNAQTTVRVSGCYLAAQ